MTELALWRFVTLILLFLVHQSSQSFLDNLLSLGRSKRSVREATTLELPLKKLKRRQASGYEIDAKQLFNDEIEYLITTIPGAIETAIAKTDAYQRVKIFKRMTWGYAILVASWFDVYSDFVAKNRTLGNLGGKEVMYKYAFLSISGVGFSFPLLLGLPDFVLDCGLKDYEELLNQYELTRGLDPLFEKGYTSAEVRSIVEEFDLWLRVKLQCVLDFEEEVPEAQELLFNADELNAAMNLRLDLQDLEEAEAAQDGSGGDESSGSLRRQDFCLFGRRASKKTLTSKMQGFNKEHRRNRKDGTNIFRRGQGLSSRSKL